MADSIRSFVVAVAAEAQEMDQVEASVGRTCLKVLAVLEVSGACGMQNISLVLRYDRHKTSPIWQALQTFVQGSAGLSTRVFI